MQHEVHTADSEVPIPSRSSISSRRSILEVGKTADTGVRLVQW